MIPMKSRNELTLNEATITIEEVNTFLGFAGIVPRESLTASECVGLRVALLAVEQDAWIKHLLEEITKLSGAYDEAEAKYKTAHESLVNAERGVVAVQFNDAIEEAERLSGEGRGLKETQMYGPLQQQYVDSVDGVGHQSAVDLLGKMDELYTATNDLMAHLGAYGEIDPAGPLSDRVKNALYDIDGGLVLTAQRPA